ILPKNEGQCRPLLEKLEHNGERLKVWAEVVETGEKITAELVQTKVDEFLESGEDVPDIEYVETDIKLGKKNHRAQGTGKNEWYTPQEYIEMAIQVMGHIDTDPASSEIANEKVQAERFYTLEDDGLNKEWHGSVWLNPPYAQPAINNSAEKMAAEWQSGRIDEAVVLTHNYTDTKWFHTLAGVCDAICFTRGRISFVNPEGEKAAPTQGQTFFYFGQNIERFLSIFKKKGMVFNVG
ncbi:MAG TPA: DNA N-6-adenine-methyltransferase, partial [Bacteroidales bacterium]|nr:DNA N-6-adenine-methyltransferase [Bacteroidales bacterium]